MTRMLRGRTALFSVLLVLIVVPFAWRLKSTTVAAPGEGGEPENSANGEPPAPDAPAIDALVPLIRCGLDAQSLAAAGISAGQATSIAQNAKAALLADPKHLSDADVAYAAARSVADVLQRKIQSGRATQEEIASYAPIAAIAETKKSERDAAIEALFGIATQGLAPEAVAKLQTIRANRAAWSAPVEFLVVNRTEKDWVKLRDALANERISAKFDEPADQALAAQLATWRADAAVAAAKAGLNSNLSLVDAALTAASH